MKRYIHESKYVSEGIVLFDDSLLVDISVTVPESVLSSISSSEDVVIFPGVEQFKKDVTAVLENEYHFDVIEDVYDGVKQKGYISNRDDSISIYFDTYFDLSNAQPALDRLGIRLRKAPETGKVYCFIHLRFSDHELNDLGDVNHRIFIAQNAQKYESQQSVTYIVPEESIVLPEETVYRYYTRALEELKDELDVRIAGWVRKCEKFYS